jgi:hypothetical protein
MKPAWAGRWAEKTWDATALQKFSQIYQCTLGMIRFMSSFYERPVCLTPHDLLLTPFQLLLIF